MADKELVYMSPRQVELGREVGRQRHEHAKQNGWQHNQNRGARNDARDLATDELGALGELAWHIWLGRHWSVWHCEMPAPGERMDDKPDIEDFIDIKAVSETGHRLQVGKGKLHRSWAYGLCVCKPPWFWVRGWRWGHDIAGQPFVEPQRNRPCQRFENDELWHPSELLEIALARRGLTRAA